MGSKFSTITFFHEVSVYILALKYGWMIILIIKIVFIFSGGYNPDLLKFVLLCYLLLLAYINIWMYNTRHILFEE